jgi:acetoin utilization protein AcuB
MQHATTIAEWMTPMPHTIGQEQTLTAAQAIMDKHEIRHLPVLHGGKLVGLLSERDVGLIGALNDVNPDVVKVEEAMSAEPWTVRHDTPVTDVIREMTRHKYGSAVVLDDHGKLLGIFTTHDALQVLGELLDSQRLSQPPPPR